MTKKVIDCNDSVLCDQCNKDYSDSNEEGGFIFGSHAVCPDCASRMMESIKKYHEEGYIKEYCQDGMSFRDFVRAYRGDNNKITVITYEALDNYFGGKK